MEKPTSQLVEEAVLAVKQGEISLETGESRFGTAWPEIKGEVALILDLEKAGQSFKANLPTPNLDRMWSRILPDLTLVEILSVTGSEANPDQLIQPNIVKINRPKVEKMPAEPVASEKAPEPISLPARKSGWEKWRKPLVWAAAIVLIAVISFSSLVGVANASEPGDFFYGTKIWLDGARQVVAFSPQDKRNFALSYCNHRSEEMEYLVKNNKLQYFADVADDYQQTLQKGFSGDITALSSEQVSQLIAQQTRLTQLSSQLSAVNATASANVDKLLEQITTYQTPDQTSPVPTTTPATSTPAALTPSVSPTLTTTPSVAANFTTTVQISVTASTTVTKTALPAPSITKTVLPAPTLKPAITPTVAATKELSPTIEISGTIPGITGTPGMSVMAPPASTPTPTQAAGNSGSSVVLNYNPTPGPTQTDSDNDADDQGSSSNSDRDGDHNPGNSNGNGNQQNNGQPTSPATQPAAPPTAAPDPPTARRTVAPKPTATPTPAPAQTTKVSGGDDEDKDKEPKATKEPKTEKPTKTPKADKTKKP